MLTDDSVRTRNGGGLDGETMMPDLIRAHPQTRRVFDRYGLRGCGGRFGPVESVAFFARSHGVDEPRLLHELREAIDAPPPPPPQTAPATGEKSAASVASAAAVADTIYRRYFTAAIVTVLTAGATWGAWILWRIGMAGRFTGVSVQDVNAHGHAQIYGWVGLFIMGFAYQAFPRLWHTDLAAPRLAVGAFAMMVAGLLVRTVAMPLGGGPWPVALALAGGGLEAGAVLLFAAQIAATYRRSLARTEPYVGFIFAALFWFIAQAALDLWHTYATMTAASPQDLLWHVATYQAPLRDLQVHGLALTMILGVSIRKLPALFGLAPVPARRAWLALALLTAAVAGECGLFVAYRWSGNHVLAAFLLVPWLMLAAAAALVALPWRLWRPTPRRDRSAKFVRAAYGWLALSLAMLLLLPAYQHVSGLKFSHAYYGAIRHAITVGFVSLMILGVAAKVVPTLNGVDPRELPALRGPFALVNLGCFLRVATQTLTDWHPGFFWVIGVSGTLEVAGLAWWGAGLLRLMRDGKRLARQDDDHAAAAAAAGPRPPRVEAAHRVADVLAWFPAADAVFDRYGFTPLRRPLLRRTLARGVTVAQAAALRGVSAPDLLAALNDAADDEPSEAGQR